MPWDGEMKTALSQLARGLQKSVQPVRGDMIVANSDGVYNFVAIGGANTVWFSDGTDPSWTAIAAAAAHPILDGSFHTDSVADGVTRGSIIYGNSTPKWDEKALGTQGYYLASDGSDLVYRNLDHYNGTFLEPLSFTVAAAGGTITGSLEKAGTGDLTMHFSDGESTLDCTPAKTVTLTAGADNAPQKNYVYLLQSDKSTLVRSTSDWPNEEHIKIAEVILQSAATVQSISGGLANRNWNDFAKGADDQGHATHAWERLRWEHSAWKSGAATTYTRTANGGAADNMDVRTTAAKVYQLHLQDVDAFNTAGADVVRVVNTPAPNAYATAGDLATLLTDSGGGSMSGKYYNLVLWASVSSGSEKEFLFVNLPSGSYNKQGDATADVNGYDNFTIPSDFRGYAFMISRITLRHQAASSGTTTSIQETDLRGLVPNIVAGGGTASITTEFADNQFIIFDDGDPTKELAFQVSGVSPSTTRTVTIPDADVTLLTDEAVEDIAGPLVASGGTKTLITVTYQDATGDMDFVVDNDLANYDNSSSGFITATLTTEEVQDIAGPLVASGGTKTGIAVTYQDATGDMDFVVDHDAANNFEAGEHFTMLDEDDMASNSATQAATQQSVKAYVDGAAGHAEAHGISVHTEHANWKVLYTDGSGDEQELALAADGTFLQANGVGAAPTFAALVDGDIPATHSGSAHHTEGHDVADHDDTTATGAELETLTDGSNADGKHVHAAAGITDKQRGIPFFLAASNLSGGVPIFPDETSGTRIRIYIPVPPDWDESSDLYLHLWWFSNATGNADLEYSLERVTDTDESTVVNVYGGRVNANLSWTAANKIKNHTITVAAANFSLDTHLLFTWRRTTGDANTGQLDLFGVSVETTLTS